MATRCRPGRTWLHVGRANAHDPRGIRSLAPRSRVGPRPSWQRPFRRRPRLSCSISIRSGLRFAGYFSSPSSPPCAYSPSSSELGTPCVEPVGSRVAAKGIDRYRGLGHKLADDVITKPSVDEALLTISDLLIVISEVQYQPVNGSFPKATFDRVWRFDIDFPWILNAVSPPGLPAVSPGNHWAWQRVLKRCKT